MTVTAQIWQWLDDHSSVLNLGVNLAMLLVWAVYLHVFVREYRLSRRCRILINFGGAPDLEASCLISNMSSEPIYVMKVAAVVDEGGTRYGRALTEFRPGEENGSGSPPEQRTRQGPLMKGQWRDAGSFAELLGQARQLPADHDPMTSTKQDRRPLEIELTVVAIYDSDPLPVAARRCFSFRQRDGEWRLVPTMPDTKQIRRRRERRRLSLTE